MARKRTKRSTYSKTRKRESADRYGTWSQGRQERPDVIAGQTRTWPRPTSLPEATR